MRRKDREMDRAFAEEVADTCDFAVISMTCEDGAPYSVPVSAVRDGAALYFHSAMKGRKTDCLHHHPRVHICCVRGVRPHTCQFTTSYESAMIAGSAQEVTDLSEKRAALKLLCQRYCPGNMDAFENEFAVSSSRTAVWKIKIEEITGKCRK